MTMRVVQVIDTLYGGGAERLQVTLAEAMLARGICPVIVVLSDIENPGIGERLRQLNVRVVKFPGKTLFDLTRFYRLVKFLREERFDVMHVHLTAAIILGTAAGFLAHVPVVASLHSIRPDRRERLEAWVLRVGAKRILAVGNAAAEAYRGRLRGRVVDVVINPLPPQPTAPAVKDERVRAEIAGDPSRPLLITTGRLHPVKAHTDMLASMELLGQTHPNACLAIVGEGPLKQELVDYIAAHNLEGRVRLLGWRDDLPRLLAASDLFLLTSHWEGLPLALLEAMWAGLPVVSTAVGDIPQLVIPEAGILVPARDPAAIAQAVRSLLDDPQRLRRMGVAAHACVATQHTPEAWLDALLEVYESVVANSPNQERTANVC